MFIAVITTALIFDFLNGFHDSSNIVATPIASRALNPRLTLILAAIAHFVGPFLFGVEVAKTVGEGLLLPDTIDQQVILAALVSAVIWNLLTWFLGMPSSSSHALIGGLLGAAIVSCGVEVVQAPGLIKIMLALFIAPPLGFLIGFIFMRVTLWSVRSATPKVNVFFRRIQIATLIGLALGHGANDAQKTMGIITLALMTGGYLNTFDVPWWVITISATAIALGTSLGGWRLIRTLGGKIFRIRPIHGFSSQLAGAGVILGAALLGGPVSTTQVMGSAITGVGAAERLSKVRWNVARDMLIAWLVTIPATAILAALLYLGLRLL